MPSACSSGQEATILQLSLPEALCDVAPRSQKRSPTLHAVSIIDLVSTVSFPKASLADLQQMQPTLQVLRVSAAQFAGFQTAPPHMSWGSGAHTGTGRSRPRKTSSWRSALCRKRLPTAAAAAAAAADSSFYGGGFPILAAAVGGPAPISKWHGFR